MRVPGTAQAPFAPPYHFMRFRIPAISIALLIPCWWQRHIEAGDLGSHVYNAWLAQLIEKGQAPGLHLAHLWNNVFFDVLLLKLGNPFGLAAAEKLAVSLCVLVFFWGVFAFVAAVTERLPWMLAPAIAVLAYGYSFQMGFMNYYVSVGLACFALALLWRSSDAWGLAMAAAIGAFAFVAHPIGFLLFAGLGLYRIAERIGGWWRIVTPLSAAGALFAVHWYLAHRWSREIDWSAPPFYLMNGADQIVVYGRRYVWLAAAALAFAVARVIVEALALYRDARWRKELALILALYVLALLAAAVLPENLRSGMYAGWIGLIVSRLTTVTAIFGLCVIGFVRPQRWHLAGFAAVAAVYFAFLYQDQLWMNGMEANAESVLRRLPYGTRIIPTIAPPDDWRVTFIGHLADRACVGHCFVYSNYEAPTRQFRVRVAASGSPLVTSSEDDAEDMEGGTYEVQDTDPPLTLLYQCDVNDLRKLCLHDLVEGETTGSVGLHPPAGKPVQ